MIRAVIFDWGGTLTPWHEVDLVAQWYAYAEVYDPVNAASLAVRLRDAEMQRWRVQLLSNGQTSTGALDSIFLDEGIDISSDVHSQALESYLRFWDPHTFADPQAEGLLQALRADGLSIGVLSNTLWPRSHHEAVFARDGLLPLIDAAAYTSEMPMAKPHVDAFTTIADMLEVSPRDAVFVGDRIWDDILGAQQAGMKTIHIPHSRIPDDQVPDGSAIPDAVIDELGEVLDVVRGWQ